jgi:charged multivesicular body protein 4
MVSKINEVSKNFSGSVSKTHFKTIVYILLVNPYFIPILYISVALQALKRKKRYEAQLNQIDGTLTTLEYQREALENANTNTEVFKVMASAAKASKAAHAELDIDKVHDLKDEINEQQDIAREISEAISNPISGLGDDMDEDELLKELEELEQENLDKELLDLPTTGPLPDVPSEIPAGIYLKLIPSLF